MPPLLGQIQGTPTIRAFVPRRGSSRNAKQALEYEQAREVKDLMRFAVSNMPNFVEVVKGEAALAALEKKAAEWGLPIALVFSQKPGVTSSSLKSLSAEYRRRLLIGELKEAGNSAAIKRFEVKSYPTVIGLPAGGGKQLRFGEGKQPSHGSLGTFLGKLAVAKAVLQKPAAADKEKVEL